MSKKVLLVEGPDDFHVFSALCEHHHVPELFKIFPCGGCSKLLEGFQERFNETDLKALGIIVDADTDFENRWASIRNLLVKAGYPDVPDTIPGTGLILEAPPTPDTLLPKVGVWLMPDNTVPGILENFLHYLVPDGDRLYEYAGVCLDSMDPALCLFRDADRPKAHIHTWLAWQNEPGKPLGQSITRGVLRADSPVAQNVVAWLTSLFSE